MVPLMSSLGAGMSESGSAARELIAEIQSIFRRTLGAVRDHTCATERIQLIALSRWGGRVQTGRLMLVELASAWDAANASAVSYTHLTLPTTPYV